MPLITDIVLDRIVTKEDPNRPERGSAELDVTVVSSSNIEPEIFVYQVDVQSRYSPEGESFYYAVASTHDMAVLPGREPVGQEPMEQPFFRLSKLTLSFPRLEDLESFWTQLTKDIKDLVRANDALINGDFSDAVRLKFESTGITPEEIAP